MSVSVQVVGQAAVHRMLARWLDPDLTKRLQAASKKSANVYKAPLRNEAGAVSKRMGKAVTVRRNKKSQDRPGSHVMFRRKVAFFAGFVVRGTRDHGPKKASALAFKTKDGRFVRASRVRGVKANPMVARVAERHERQAAEAFKRAMEA